MSATNSLQDLITDSIQVGASVQAWAIELDSLSVLDGSNLDLSDNDGSFGGISEFANFANSISLEMFGFLDVTSVSGASNSVLMTDGNGADLDVSGNMGTFGGLAVQAGAGGLLFYNSNSNLNDTNNNLYTGDGVTIIADVDGNLYCSGPVGQALISGGLNIPITFAPFGQQVAYDTGWVNNESDGDRTVNVQDFAASGFSGTMQTALNTVSAGTGDFFATLAQQVQDLTNKLQAIEYALTGALLPNN